MKSILVICGLFCCAVCTFAAEGNKEDDKRVAGNAKLDSSPKGIASRAFRSADKDEDGSLSEEETRTARTILRGALLGKLTKSSPGEESTREKIGKLPTQGNPDDNGDGKVTSAEFEQYVLERFKQLDEIVEKAIKAADKQRELAKQRLAAEQRKQAEKRRDMDRRQNQRQREKRDDQRDKQKMQDLKQKNKQLEQKLKEQKNTDK